MLTDPYLLFFNDPINKTDPMGLAPGDIYLSPDAAGIDAIRDINDISIALNMEFGGRVYQLGPNAYSYTAPIPGFSNRVSPGEVPPGTTNEGRYHTHGPMSYGESDNFHSPQDKTNSEAERKPSYLGTPSREVKKYTPDPQKPGGGQTETLGTSQPDPTPPPEPFILKLGPDR